MEQEEKLCTEVETVRQFTYLVDRVGGGCEANVTARTRHGCVNLMECSELPYGRFHEKLKRAVHKRYIRK